MKLTKGKISKLLKKSKQSKRKYKIKKDKNSKRSRTFRKKHKLNLANKTIKNSRFFKKTIGGEVGTNNISTETNANTNTKISDENMSQPITPPSELLPENTSTLAEPEGQPITPPSELLPETSTTLAEPEGQPITPPSELLPETSSTIAAEPEAETITPPSELLPETSIPVAEPETETVTPTPALLPEIETSTPVAEPETETVTPTSSSVLPNTTLFSPPVAQNELPKDVSVSLNNVMNYVTSQIVDKMKLDNIGNTINNTSNMQDGYTTVNEATEAMSETPKGGTKKRKFRLTKKRATNKNKSK
jgi:hypothetical protein